MNMNVFLYSLVAVYMSFSNILHLSVQLLHIPKVVPLPALLVLHQLVALHFVDQFATIRALPPSPHFLYHPSIFILQPFIPLLIYLNFSLKDNVTLQHLPHSEHGHLQKSCGTFFLHNLLIWPSTPFAFIFPWFVFMIVLYPLFPRLYRCPPKNMCFKFDCWIYNFPLILVCPWWYIFCMCYVELGYRELLIQKFLCHHLHLSSLRWRGEHGYMSQVIYHFLHDHVTFTISTWHPILRYMFFCCINLT